METYIGTAGVTGSGSSEIVSNDEEEVIGRIQMIVK